MLGAIIVVALAGLRIRFETEEGLLYDNRRCTAPHQRVPVAQPDGAAVPAVSCTSTVTTDCYYECTRDDIFDDFHTTLLTDLLLPAVAREVTKAAVSAAAAGSAPPTSSASPCVGATSAIPLSLPTPP